MHKKYNPHSLIPLLLSLFLAACGGGGGSGGDPIIPQPGNTAPIARISADLINTQTGETVTLSAANSSDPDGDPLKFSWDLTSKPEGSSAELTNPGDAVTQLTLDTEGSYTVTLVASDGFSDSSPATLVLSAGENLKGGISVQSPTITAGQSTRLSAIPISGIDPDELSFAWRIVDEPGGASLSAIDEPETILTTALPGEHVISLTVSSSQNSDTRQITVFAKGLPDNRPPSASIFTESTRTTIGEALLFDGRSSSDPDNDLLSFTWELTEKPPGSSAVLSGSSDDRVYLTADLQGEYTVTLQVSDGELTSPLQTLTVTASPPGANTPPEAIITPEEVETSVGVRTYLDGFQSTDPDGDSLSYRWQLLHKPAGSQSALTNSTSSATYLTPDTEGEYRIELIVSDGRIESTASLATVTATEQDNNLIRPIADAGEDQLVSIGDEVLLDGRGSSTENEGNLFFSWTLVSTPSASTTLSNNTSATPHFTPDHSGTYLVQLIVNNGQLNSEPDTVEIQVNAPPVSDAGDDRQIDLGSHVTLDGGASSDPDTGPQPLAYRWQVHDPDGAPIPLEGADQKITRFTPLQTGIYTLSLTVDDGLDSHTAQAIVEVVPAPDQQPVADAGGNTVADTGETVYLNGSDSFDPDSDPLTFHWSFTNRPADSLLEDADIIQSPSSPEASFTPDRDGRYDVALTVNDGTLDSDPDTVIITAISRPVADAGPDRSVGLGAEVTLNAGDSHAPQGNTLAYSWTFDPPATSMAELSSPQGQIVSFIPDVPGSYRIGLTVDDEFFSSDEFIVEITAVNTFMRTYGGAGVDFGGPVHELEDGSGYIIGGESNSPSIAEQGDYDMVLIATDSAGNEIWREVYGGAGAEELWSLAAKPDGGFYLAGFSNSFGEETGDSSGAGDAYLVETTSRGVQLNQKTYGSTDLDQAQVVLPTADGGLILAGYTQSPDLAPQGVNDANMYVIKQTAGGEVAWERSYGGELVEDAWGIAEKPDGSGFLVAGFTDSYADKARGDAYIVEIDADGNQLSSLTLGEPGLYDEFYDLRRIGNSNRYIAVGYTESHQDSNGDFYFVIISNDASGELRVEKEIALGGTAHDEAHAVALCDDGGFALIGTTLSYGHSALNPNILLIRTDGEGNQIWQHTYGGTASDQSWSITQTMDGGYLIGGNTASIGQGLQDILLIKTGPDGNVAPLARPLPPLSQNEGTGVDIDGAAGFLEPNAQPLTFEAINLPAGLAVNANTGRITGTLPDMTSDRTIQVTLIATDPNGLSATSTLKLTIKDTD